MPNKHKDEERVFKAVAKLKNTAERTTYLKELCAGDTPLLNRVQALLDVADGIGDFLETPVLEMTPPYDELPLTEGVGSIIGRYKLLEKIGEGGMAVVYMAEQQEPIRRKVALKIIKLGMDTKAVIARFEAERQALAMMDHPNIAKVLDAGATETGRPYFVMELVTGVSTTEYCDKNKLSTARRLDLFLQICSAVQHAHQKGIIHRDIKPTNVMVTLHDGKPVPKVIDFGIAKAVNQRLTEKTLFTRYGHMVGTPPYMSPEQAEMSGLDVDTRTDVYSLGVLLYELLTGTTPFDAEKLREAGYVEMQRIIHEEPPTKPSTKLSTMGDTLAQIAESRNTKPDLLSRLIRGDLDWIVMKSLEKDRMRRYESASALGADVQRHLNHKPVEARAPGAVYHLQKFLYRHRSEAIAAAVIAILLSALTVMLVAWSHSQRQLAKTTSIRDTSILSLARESFSKGDPVGALKSLRSILNSKHVGPDACLLYAGILVEDGQPDEAISKLNDLLDERPEIAGAAYLLLARVLWESEFSDSEKLEKTNEYRQKAKELFPETAEAYFLQAMTALTIKEKLELLTKALSIDSHHYESYRLRAFMYYASRKYEQMKDDAVAMVVLRSQDPLGYSLRAIALRELDNCEHAIADYETAIGLTSAEDPQLVELYAQRSDIYLRMGQYEQAVADAKDGLALFPNETIFHFRVFCAQIALGNYEEASSLYCRITDSDLDSKHSFRDWSMKYVFDTLDAGRSWHLPEIKPEGIAFLSMLEAERTYRQLSTKGRRLITDGFSADWSPDGTKLAFTLGVHGYSGLAFFDPASEEIELLIVPGKDPRWSPDGQYIAFVRDCSSLRLSELTAAERRAQERPCAEEEVWIMDANGTKPERLTRGGWHSWSKDSRQIYYHSRSDPDRMLCSISIEEREAEPILACPSFFPSVSPDSKYVAYLEDRFLKIIDLASHSPVSEWAVPPKILAARWMPNSRQFSLRGWNDSEFKTGLWIYDMEEGEAAKVLTGQIGGACLSPDEMRLVFSLGPPLYEIWVADLDPNVSTIEALGPGQTPEEYCLERIEHYTEIITAGSKDPNDYLRRAEYYLYLKDEEKTNADMRAYGAIVHPQKNMSGYNDGLETGGHQESHVSFIFGTPTNLGPVVNSSDYDWNPSMSADGRELYFDSRRSGDWDIWVSKRATTEDSWGSPVNLGFPVNGPHWDQGPSISADGLMLFFSSLRSGDWDIWITTRTTRDDPWSTPANLGPIVNSSCLDIAPCTSPNGLWLFFGSERPGGYGSADLWLTTRETINDDWSKPVNLGFPVNSVLNEGVPSISADGLLLFFSGAGYGPFRSEGYGNADLWVTMRASTSGSWNKPVNLGPNVNSAHYDMTPYISMDGSTLYFASNRDGERLEDFDLWQVPITYVSPSVHQVSNDELIRK